MTTPYKEIKAINVNEHVEKKGRFSYLSWAWAVDKLLELDSEAEWFYSEPSVYPDGTMMVFCTVKALGRTRTAQLAVMGFKNQAVQNPNACEINKAMQRCLAKAIALHGLGLYIYAGEDLPDAEDDRPQVVVQPKPVTPHVQPFTDQEYNMLVSNIKHCKTPIELKAQKDNAGAAKPRMTAFQISQLSKEVIEKEAELTKPQLQAAE